MIETFDKYLYKTVRVRTKDGRVIEGPVRSFEGSVSSKSGFPEMDIDYGDYVQVVDESEIEGIEILAE